MNLTLTWRGAPLGVAAVVAATVGLTAIGLTAARVRSPRALFMSASTPPDSAAVPVLRLALGDSVSTVTRNSTIPLPPRADPLRDPPFIIAGKPVVVEYTRPGTLTRFPTGLFTSVSVEYGHAVDLRLSPHLRALTLGEALVLAREIGTLVESTGWRRVDTDIPLETLPAAVEAARHTVAGEAVGYQARLARWAGDAGDTLSLGIRRQASADAVRDENALLGKHRPEVDHFLLNLEIENAAVSDQYYRLTVAARDRSGVTVPPRP